MVDSIRRAALVWNADIPLTKTSFPIGSYSAGLEALGVETLTLCRSGAELGYRQATRTFEDEIELLAPGFWEDLGCDVAVIVTWHRMTDILRAMRAAGMLIVNVVESDGRSSIRDYPWDTLRYRFYGQPSLRGKIAALKFWMGRYMTASHEERALLENAAASDVVTVANQSGVEDFQRTLERLHASQDLIERVKWLPYPVSEYFCGDPVNSAPRDGIIAIGRWDSAQKHPHLLARALEFVLEARPDTAVAIVGPGSDSQFTALLERFPRLAALGAMEPERIRGLMSTSRILMISSRWESGPIVASEMLALGGTIVGTPIPTVRGLCRDARFGRTSTRATPAALGVAALAELDAWDRGERHPLEIAGHWRELVCAEKVASRMLRLLPRLVRMPGGA